MGLHHRAGAQLALALTLLSTSAVAQLTLGDVIGESEIDAAALGSALELGDRFGHAVTALGDIDGDGFGDVAFGAPGDGPGNAGAVWVVQLTPSGGVKEATRLASGISGMPTFDNDDAFGSALASLGDVDGDGVPDLAIGAPGDDGNDLTVSERGAVWIAFLQTDGTARAVSRLGDGTPGLGALPPHGSFGDGLAPLGDFDGDGFGDLFVGATSRSLLGDGKGKGYVLSLGEGGAVLNTVVIDELSVPGGLATGDLFGSAAAVVSDPDGDSAISLAIASRGANGGYGFGAGRVALFELTADGTVTFTNDIGLNAGIDLDGGDQFGSSLAALGDLDGDGIVDLAIGAEGDDDGDTNLGAYYVVFLSIEGNVTLSNKVSATKGGLDGPLAPFARLGAGLAVLDDVNGDDVIDLVAGAPGGASSWLLFAQGFKDETQQPFAPLVPALDGRPGRASLALPPGTSDKIDEPIVGVPGLDKDSVIVTSPILLPEKDVIFIDLAVVPTGQNPTQALTEDFSSDDRDDIITSNLGDDTLSYLEAVGPTAPGLFDPKADLILPTGFAPISITTNNFGGSPASDVVAAGAGGLFGFFSDGAGGFAPMPPIPNVALLTDIVSGDVDGDGDNDLVTGSGAIAQAGLETGFVTVLLNDGAGNFTIAGTFASGKAVASVLLGDFDTNDASDNLDVLVAIHEFADPALNEPVGRVQLWVGDGSGVFNLSALFADVVVPNENGSHPTYGAVGDINADGTLDAVYTSSDNLAYPPEDFADAQAPIIITVLVNDGSGSFNVVEVGTAYSGKGITPLLIELQPEPANSLDLVLIWYQDLLAGTLGSQIETFLAFFVGQPNGEFFDPSANQFLTGEEPGNGDVADVDSATDADGSPDLLIPSLKENSFTVFINDGEAEFTPGTTVRMVDDFVAPSFFEGGPWDLRVASLDADNITDVIVHNLWRNVSPLPMPGDLLAASSVSAFIGDGVGGFTRSDYEPLVGEGEMILADLDGDGLDDVIVTERGREVPVDRVRVLRARGGGAIDPDPAVFLPSGFTLSGGIAAADLTGDGLPDIATAATDATGAGFVLVFANVGATLSAPTAFPLDASWTDVRSLAIDFINDGNVLDVAVGCLDGRLVLATGTVNSVGAINNFELVPTEAVAADVGGGALSVGDVNGDGRRDVISSADGASGDGISQSQVHSLVASGVLGAYAVETLAGTSSTGVLGALRPLLADLDANETIDLVLTHGTSSAVSILLNELSTFEEFGPGKPGKGGLVPRLFGLGYTTPGGKLSVNVEGALGGAMSLLIVSREGAQMGPDFLHVGAPLGELFVPLSGTRDEAGSGGFSLVTRLQPNTALVGLEFTLQTFIDDPFAEAATVVPSFLGGALNFAATNGLRFTVVQ